MNSLEAFWIWRISCEDNKIDVIIRIEVLEANDKIQYDRKWVGEFSQIVY